MIEGLDDSLAIERRTRAVATVRRIMHAVWVVSRSQYARAERMTEASVAYYRWLDDAIERLSELDGSNERPRLCVVIGPERGLCGPLVRALEEAIPTDSPFALVGTRLARRSRLADRALFTAAGVANADEIERRATELGALIVEYGTGYDVELTFPISGTGTLHRELLLAARRPSPDARLDSYSPTATLLEAVLGQALGGRLAHALAQCSSAELGARILVAERARDHCDEQLQALRDLWAVQQKAEITAELGELTAGRLGSAR